AGVIGGLESEVTDATVNVLLEAATFSGPSRSAPTPRCGRAERRLCGGCSGRRRWRLQGAR
ncbi:MAG: hypothetical protein EPO22_06590, partial [Dehalococcoidia bacterium]